MTNLTTQKPGREVNYYDYQDCMHYAAEVVKGAGFILAEVSMQSEASYYKYPGKDGLLRIAAHRYGRTQSRLNPKKNVVACLTFGNTYSAKSKGSVDAKILTAVGKFFVRSLHASEYLMAYDEQKP